KVAYIGLIISAVTTIIIDSGISAPAVVREIVYEGDIYCMVVCFVGSEAIAAVLGPVRYDPRRRGIPSLYRPITTANFHSSRAVGGAAIQIHDARERRLAKQHGEIDAARPVDPAAARRTTS